MPDPTERLNAALEGRELSDSVWREEGVSDLASEGTPMSELRREMQTDLRIRNYAERTQAIYITRVAETARHLQAITGGSERRGGS